VHTFGQRVKCEHTLVCIVIDGRNVSNGNVMWPPCSQCGRDISTRS